MALLLGFLLSLLGPGSFLAMELRSCKPLTTAKSKSPL